MSPIRKSNVSFYAGLCLLFSLWEMAIPKPVSFVRLGLSNLALMLALYSGFSFKEFACLVLMKIASASVLSGTLFSYVFLLSICSSLSSSLCLYLLFRTGAFSFIGQAVLSAAVGNVSQIAIAMAILGRGVLNLGPVILGFGLCTSLALGSFTQYYVDHSRVLDSLKDMKIDTPYSTKGSYISLLWLVLSPLLLFLDFGFIKVGIFLLALFANLIKRNKLRLGVNALTFVFIVILSLVNPSGEVLASILGMKITRNALFEGLGRAIGLVGTLYVSRLCRPGLQKLSCKSRLLGSSLAVFSLLSQASANKPKKGRGLKTMVDFLDERLVPVIDFVHGKTAPDSL